MQPGLMIAMLMLQVPSVDYQYDENGKVIFTDVVYTQLDSGVLLSNVHEYMACEEKSEKPDSCIKASSLKLYKRKVGKQPHGELTFLLLLEVRRQRYRYVLYNFVFHPMERNRYGRFERIRNQSVGLEVCLAEPERIWKQHKESILTKMESFIENMHKELTTVKKEKEIIKITDEW